MFGLKKMEAQINEILSANKKNYEAFKELVSRIDCLEEQLDSLSQDAQEKEEILDRLSMSLVDIKSDVLKVQSRKKPGRKPKTDAKKDPK